METEWGWDVASSTLPPLLRLLRAVRKGGYKGPALALSFLVLERGKHLSNVIVLFFSPVLTIPGSHWGTLVPFGHTQGI